MGGLSRQTEIWCGSDSVTSGRGVKSRENGFRVLVFLEEILSSKFRGQSAWKRRKVLKALENSCPQFIPKRVFLRKRNSGDKVGTIWGSLAQLSQLRGRFSVNAHEIKSRC